MGKTCFQIESKRTFPTVISHSKIVYQKKMPIEMPHAHAFLGDRLLTSASSGMKNSCVIFVPG